MARYKLTNSTSILREDGAVIPANPFNADYQDYLEWVAAGNIADPADPPPDPSTVPPSIEERLQAAETLINLILDEGTI